MSATDLPPTLQESGRHSSRTDLIHIGEKVAGTVVGTKLDA